MTCGRKGLCIAVRNEKLLKFEAVIDTNGHVRIENYNKKDNNRCNETEAQNSSSRAAQAAIAVTVVEVVIAFPTPIHIHNGRDERNYLRHTQ